jgi:hypothetical protein
VQQLARYLVAARKWIESFTKPTRLLGRAPAVGKAKNPDHTHGTIERNGHDIPGTHGPACSVNALAIDPQMS